MKKTMKLMMMAIAAIVLSVGFAACSDDDDPTPDPTPDPSTVVDHYQLVATYSANKDLYDLTSTFAMPTWSPVDEHSHGIVFRNTDGQETIGMRHTIDGNSTLSTEFKISFGSPKEYKSSYTFDISFSYKLYRVMKDNKTIEVVTSPLLSEVSISRTIEAKAGQVLTKEDVSNTLESIENELNDNFKKTLKFTIDADKNIKIEEVK